MNETKKIKFLKALKRKMRFNVSLCVVGKFNFYGLTYKNVSDIMDEQKISIEEGITVLKKSKEWEDYGGMGWRNNTYKEALTQKGCVKMRIWMANIEYKQTVVLTRDVLERKVLFEKTEVSWVFG